MNLVALDEPLGSIVSEKIASEVCCPLFFYEKRRSKWETGVTSKDPVQRGSPCGSCNSTIQRRWA